MNNGIAVLIFGALVLGAEIFIMVRRDKGWGQSNKQMVGLTLVVIVGLFLVVGNYSQESTGPMFGLLAAIAGYLFGAGGNDQGNT